MMQLSRLKSVAKQAWLAIILLSAAYFVYTRFDMVVLAVKQLPSYLLAGSVALIIIGKILLSANMMYAARQAGIPITYADCFRIYNMTQLAKYIPGSIWQFVGRVVILRERGASNAEIRDSMLAEHAWVMGSALFIAFITIGMFTPSFALDLLQRYDLGFADIYLYLLAAVVAALIVALLIFRLAYRWLLRMRPGWRSAVTLAGVWCALGVAFWIIFRPFVDSAVPCHYVIGLYCLAYVIGFLVPFAPAGLGVRESILAFGLLPYMGIETALLMAGINRIAYFVAELVVVSPFIIKVPDFTRNRFKT